MLWVPRDSLLINLRKYENQARAHFIPNLKVGVFVTLRAPDVIKKFSFTLMKLFSSETDPVLCSYSINRIYGII